MKKVLSSLVMAIITVMAFGQTNPCPDIQGFQTNVLTNDGVNCTATVTIFATGDVASQKSLRIEVLCNNSVIVKDECFIVPPNSPSTGYTTTAYSCNCGMPITYRITRYTASNGSCQGGTCGNIIEIQQSPLPVNLKSFDARRNKSNVDITWQTVTEENNRGFYVERKISTGNWEKVGFVASKAPNGNSNSQLSYSFTDVNNTKGMTQYRLNQFDLDGKSTVTTVRVVRGEEQKSKTIVYPNPSNDGKVNVVFEDQNAVRDVTLADMNGRTIRQWRRVTNNNLQIDNLNPGFYTLRILNTETNEQVVEKIVVNKR